MTQGALVVSRFRRPGIDRLYVRTQRGRAIGYLDLLTSKSVVQDFAMADGFRAAVEKWMDAKGAVVKVAPGGTNLSTVGAGASVRAKQAELNERSPMARYAESLIGRDQAESWRLGAEGEEAVARELERLPGGWLALHSVPVGSRGSDIDHVIVGPRGVFTINAKNHGQKPVKVKENAILVGGRSEPYARNARFEAARAATLLSQACGFPVAVTGLVVFTSASECVTVIAQPRDGKVVMLSLDQLVPWLLDRELALAPRWARAVAEQAKWEKTWVVPVRGTIDGDNLLH